jgi:hypothetical protein
MGLLPPSTKILRTTELRVTGLAAAALAAADATDAIINDLYKMCPICAQLVRFNSIFFHSIFVAVLLS